MISTFTVHTGMSAIVEIFDVRLRTERVWKSSSRKIPVVRHSNVDKMRCSHPFYLHPPIWIEDI